MTWLASPGRGLRRAGAPPRAASGGSVLRLYCISQRRRSGAHLGVGIGNGCGVGTSVGVVEPSDRRVEPLPELARAAPTCARAQLVRGLGVLRSWDRTPCQPKLCRLSTDGRLRCRSLGKGAEPTSEPEIRRSEPVSTHCGPPLVLRLLEPIEHLSLASSTNRRIRRLAATRRHSRLPSRCFLGVDETSPRRSLFPSPRRRCRPALERGQQLLEVLSRHPPNLSHCRTTEIKGSGSPR